MIREEVFYPLLAMVTLTFVVWLRLYFVRIAEMRRLHIHPQSVATSAEKAARLVDTRAADNFNNLFEVPVLFYVALVVAYLTEQVTPSVLALAWGFVVGRVLHSLIHCSYNKVMHRFGVYAISTGLVWALWVVLAVGLLRP
ncbi:MAPEG family protein [Lysobacter koreensis]|uniref:MAPEG family protein n=1 Tax=Lysobacter koreensis TaxID=266122 RepID=A0ABW2YPD8_9GAMM